jgi:hypothetical protein
VPNVKFMELDIRDMNPRILGGTFDLVLNMALLFHVSDPLGVLQRTITLSHRHVLLDTAVFNSKNPFVKLQWEEPADTFTANRAGIVTYPTTRAIDMMLMQCGAGRWFEIPIRSRDLPRDYLERRHASWLITV